MTLKMSPEVRMASGALFNFHTLNVEDVSIEDIAHGLSHVCRFGGHSTKFYSVAEHSVRVADILAAEGWSPGVIYDGLMHDATEALMGDIPAPLKQLLPDYRALEEQVEEALSKRFRFVPRGYDGAIKQADIEALAWEFPRLMRFPENFVWPYDTPPAWPKPGEAPFDPRGPGSAKQLFLLYFERFAPPEVKR